MSLIAALLRLLRIGPPDVEQGDSGLGGPWWQWPVAVVLVGAAVAISSATGVNAYAIVAVGVGVLVAVGAFARWLKARDTKSSRSGGPPMR